MLCFWSYGCVMTTYDSDMQEHDLHILRHVVEEFDGRMALDSAVIQSGRLPVGTPVELLSWHRDVWCSNST